MTKLTHLITDDGELIEAVEVSAETVEAQDDSKPKEKRTRIQRYVYSGIGYGIGIGIVAAVLIGLVALVGHAQHQFAIGEWKLPQLIPSMPTPNPSAPTTLQDSINQSMEIVGAIFNSIIPICLVVPIVVALASLILKSMRSSLE